MIEEIRLLLGFCAVVSVGLFTHFYVVYFKTTCNSYFYLYTFEIVVSSYCNTNAFNQTFTRGHLLMNFVHSKVFARLALSALFCINSEYG